MARYIKANPLVAKFLHLEEVRNTVKDGNYLLWQADMQQFGPLSTLSSILEQIGGIVLTPHEAREEQDGTVTRPLPEATDARFIPVTTPAAEETPENGTEPAPAEETTEESGAGHEGPQYETPEYETPEYAEGEPQTEETPAEETTNEGQEE